MPIQGKIDKPYGAGLKIITKEITLDGTYTAGGVSTEITELKVVHDAYVMSVSGGYIGEATDISGRTFKIKIYYFDYDAAADGPAIEIPDGTDVTGMTVKVLVIGE